MIKGQVIGAALVLGAMGLFGPPAGADEVDDYTKKLTDLDQRVQERVHRGELPMRVAS